MNALSGSSAGCLTRSARDRVAQASGYRRLLGDAAWQRLQADIRRRFSAPAGACRQPEYSGTMTVRRTRAGWLLARLCQPLGRPLASGRGDAVAVRVRLIPAGHGAVTWERDYRFAAGREIVRSTKRVAGGVLSEHIGGGLSMQMKLQELAGNLYFVSTGYRLHCFGLSLPLPAWLTPGKIVVAHEVAAPGRFRFTLSVTHPWLGEMYYQQGLFTDD